MGFEYASTNSDLSNEFSRKIFSEGDLRSAVMPLMAPETSPGGSPWGSEDLML